MKLGFWIPVVSGIPDSLNCIPDSISQDSRFHKQKFPRFWNPDSLTWGDRYIGETGRNLRIRFSEHLLSVRNNNPGCPVAQHFNSTGHSFSDTQVRGLALCGGANIQRKQREMGMIFQLGTVQPKGLNMNFSSIWTVTKHLSRATIYTCTCFIFLSNDNCA